MPSPTFPYVSEPGKPPKPVKNLGWLLRHAADVETLTVIEQFDQDGKPTGQAVLQAGLTDGRVYRALFQSLTVCERFALRRTFAHATIAKISSRRD